MANKEISELPEKTSPATTDELEIQETGGGTSYKATLGNLAASVVFARAKSNSSGTLQSGSLNITGPISKAGTGIYDYTLTSGVTSTSTAQMFVGVETAQGEASIRMTSTTVCRVETAVGGTATDVAHSILIFDEA